MDEYYKEYTAIFYMKFLKIIYSEFYVSSFLLKITMKVPICSFFEHR